MRKSTLFFSSILLFLFITNIYAQERQINKDDSKVFYSLGDGSTSDPILTTEKPAQTNFSAEKTELLNQLKKARLADDLAKASQIQARLNEIDGVEVTNFSNINLVEAGILEPVQHFSSTTPIFNNPDYMRSTIGSGGYWSVATFTSNRTTALFAAATKYVNGGPEVLEVYMSYDNGANWVLKGSFDGYANTVDFRAGELDIEAITNGTDTLVFVVAGYNYNGHSFSGISKFNIVTGEVNSTTFSAGGVASNGNNKYNPRITSDNTVYSSAVYVYITTAKDSATTAGIVSRSYWFGLLTSPFSSFDITYKNPNGDNGFWWHSSSASDTTYLWQDIAYLRTSAHDRIYTVFNHAGVAQGQSLYLASSDDYGTTVNNYMVVNETADVLSAKIAANGNNPNLCVLYRKDFGSDWDIRGQYSTTGGDSVGAFTRHIVESSLAQSPKLIDIQSIKNSDGGYVFGWANYDTTNYYRRTNNSGLNLSGYVQPDDILQCDTRFGGTKAGYINADVADSSLIVWSQQNGINAYCSYGLYTPVGVETEDDGIVSSYFLDQNYPNPFNPNTTIKFSIPEQANVKLIIYNSIGQEVSTLINNELSAGSHSVSFSAANLSSGIYFYRIETPNFTSTKKMILLK